MPAEIKAKLILDTSSGLGASTGSSSGAGVNSGTGGGLAGMASSMKGIAKMVGIIAGIIQAFKAPIMMLAQIVSVLLLFLKPISDVVTMLLRPVLMILARALVKFLKWWDGIKNDEDSGAVDFLKGALSPIAAFVISIDNWVDKWNEFKDKFTGWLDGIDFSDMSFLDISTKVITKIGEMIDGFFNFEPDDSIMTKAVKVLKKWLELVIAFNPVLSIGKWIFDKIMALVKSFFGVGDEESTSNSSSKNTSSTNLGKGTTAGTIIDQYKTGPELPLPSMFSGVGDFLKPKNIFDKEKGITDGGAEQFKGLSKSLEGVTESFQKQEDDIKVVFEGLSSEADKNISGTGEKSVATSFNKTLKVLNNNLNATIGIYDYFRLLSTTFTTNHIINRTIVTREKRG